jgi:acyl transferase domain-containing protein
MIAVLASPDLQTTDPVLRDSEIAAVVSSRHFVLACPAPRIPPIEQRLRDIGVSYQRLPVSYAFHSRWIEPARQAFNRDAARLGDPRTSVVCCAAGQTIGRLPEDYFWDVARRPIRLDRAVGHLELQGPHRYIDVGPSGSLATVVKYMLPRGSSSTAESVLDPFGHDGQKFDAVIARNS